MLDMQALKNDCHTSVSNPAELLRILYAVVKCATSILAANMAVTIKPLKDAGSPMQCLGQM
jgi:hypothetical protein